jgi:ADP-ribosylglycohydrolase
LGGAADALGWPNEFAKKSAKRQLIPEFRAWNKRIGRIGGYWDKIEPGEFSDDTQLTLAVARCVSPAGHYDADRFVQVELPYWLTYQRGGGRTIKAAAKNASSQRGVRWFNNAFKGYFESGANGAAMRVLPLAEIESTDELIHACWQNTLATHGHPRAIIGALVMAFALHYLLRSSDFSVDRYAKELELFIDSLNIPLKDPNMNDWLARAGKDRFSRAFESGKREIRHFFEYVRRNRHLSSQEVLEYLGCYRKSTRGSGTATVAAGQYFFLKFYDQPLKGVLEASNAFGTDTDTIGKFAGNLLGCIHGRNAYENELTEQLQNRFYFLTIVRYLTGRELPHWANLEDTETEISQVKQEGDEYYSRVFGPGIVTSVRRPTPVMRGVGRLYQLKAEFECGWRCVFSKIEGGTENKKETVSSDNGQQ